jgi:hypothetical protein
MTLSPGSRLHLVLAGGAQAVLWIAVGVVVLVLLLVLSRYELRVVSRRAGLTLLGTRLMAMLLLVAALFEPIAERRYEETIRGRVVLGVDLSESMATAEPVPAAVTGPSSLSDPAPTLTRRQITRRLLDGEWLKKIAADHQVESVGFARDTVDGTLETLARALDHPAGARDPSALVTDWNGVLARALVPGESGPVLAVVLLTDGRQNASSDAGRSVDRLAARGIPVFPVLIGSTSAPKDVAIASVKAPESVLKGDMASVEVVVKADGVPDVDLAVTLDRPGGPPLKEVVRGPADGTRPVVRFRVPMENLGTQDLAVNVAAPPGDARSDNDRRTFTIGVADDQARVLLVDGEARWEFRYLYHALKRDARVAVEAVVFRQPRFSASDDTYKTALPAAPRSGETDPLGAYDAIVVGDVEPGLLTSEAWERLESFVGRRGGTLVLAAGPRAWPNAILGMEPARKLLPVLGPKPVQYDAQGDDPAHPSLAAGVSIRPIAGAGAWPMLQLGATEESSQAIWARLPHLPWALAGRVKPGATALAIIEGTEPAGAGAVIAAQPFGLGKVMWVGTDATWRWRFRVGDTYHHRFWGQVVRWAAAGKLAAGNDWVRFGADRSRLAEGEGARLTARFADGIAGVGPDLLAVARVYKAVTADGGGPPRADGEALAIIPLQAVPGQPRTFAATAPALAAGRYVVRLEARLPDDTSKAGTAAPPEVSLEVTPRQTSELVELSAARDPLERLAAATGGRVLTGSETDQLPGLLSDRKVVKVRTEETPLWDRPWALVLFFGVLTFEWVLRKRVGLP